MNKSEITEQDTLVDISMLSDNQKKTYKHIVSTIKELPDGYRLDNVKIRFEHFSYYVTFFHNKKYITYSYNNFDSATTIYSLLKTLRYDYLITRIRLGRLEILQPHDDLSKVFAEEEYIIDTVGEIKDVPIIKMYSEDDTEEINE